MSQKNPSLFRIPLPIECRKLKRTGYFPACFAGALIGSVVPVTNMWFRSEEFTTLPGAPLEILLDANWNMMAMLNLFLVICGACIMYHTEHADNASRKMNTLPIWAGGLFLGKFFIAAFVSAFVLLAEAASLETCIFFWFSADSCSLAELAEFIGFELVILLPTIMSMLIIASICRNIWISLGIGLLFVFSASMFPAENFALSLCPFATPFQWLHLAEDSRRVLQFLCAAAAETIILGAIELIILKIRRCYE